MKIGDNHVQVDPQLFQRLITAGERCGELPLLFMYELWSFPPALFEAHFIFRENKASLGDFIWTEVGKETTLPDNVHYVLDGGSLCIVYLG